MPPSFDAPPCYFINLDRSIARKNYMIETLDKRGIVATRVPAVDGKTLTDAACRTHNPRLYDAMKLSNGEIGCFLSHRQIWERIVRDNAPYAIVFEDDIKIAAASATLLTDLSWVPADVDFIKIDANDFEMQLGMTRKIAAADRHLRRVHSISFGTAGYIISRKCAQYLLNTTQRMIAPLDNQMFTPHYRSFGKIPVWQLQPALCIQQVDTEDEQFLPQGAEVSGLANGRGTRREFGRKLPFGWQKVKRELWRPWRDAGKLLDRIITRHWHKAKPAKVNFRDT